LGCKKKVQQRFS